MELKKIRHFVITRFLCSDFGYGDKIKSPEFIKEGIRLVKTFFLPSLLNQSSHNFEIVFAIHDTIGIEKIEALRQLKTGNIKTHIVRWGNINRFICEQTTADEIVITSRMDYDDLVFRDAVSVIQNAALETSNKGYIWHGYSTGCTMIEEDKTHELHFMSKNYSGDGAWSTFQSLVLYKGKRISIYGLGDHTKIKRNIKEGKVGLSYDDGLFLLDNREMSYIWVRHQNTGSHSCSHDTAKIIMCPNNEFKFRFGISVS